ncbi:hypothetical protein BGZ72_002927 [Mortierella alpina]|nr:hypothetical protein BGZ72_002927 [Mortierella alpina]
MHENGLEAQKSDESLDSQRTGNANLLEEYALNPQSRQQLVDGCLNGTAEHYTFKLRLLSQQLQDPTVPVTAERIAEAMAFLKAAEDGRYLTQDVIQTYKAQFALLAFKVEPDLLRKKLALKSNLPALVDSSMEQDTDNSLDDICEALPTVLDQTQIKTDTLIARHLKELDSGAVVVPILAWSQLLVQPAMRPILLEQIDPVRLLKIFYSMDIMLSPHSANIIGHAEANRVDELVIDIIVRLVEHEHLDFSKSSQFARLTSEQLQRILERLPGLKNDEAFVGLIESRILPREFARLEERRKGDVQREWLERMVDLVDSLSPKFNRHKLSVYLMSLEFDLVKGIKDKDKFKRYIAIPRNHSHCNHVFLRNTVPDQVVYLENISALPYWSTRVQLATKARDDEIISEYLAYFLQLEKSTAEYEEFFEVKTFLNPLFARVMLTSGEKNTEKWSALLGTRDNLTKLTEQTILKFDRNNPETFLPSDPVAFNLKVKNAKRILIRVFEVKTMEYLQQYEGVVGQELNLDGLTPNWEHHLVMDHPPLQIHNILIELPELAGRRGAFIMDVICNGENSSIYFTKGNFDYIERQSVAGHVLTVIDENHQKVTEDVSIWYKGYRYQTNEDGDIVIPYASPSPSADYYIYITHNDFTTRRPFLHKAEQYHMELSWHVDNESLIAGAEAKILLKPVVTIRNTDVICPVELLEQVVLQVESHDTSDTTTTTTKSDFKLYDADWSVYNFQVPENFSRLDVTLSAKIKELATGNLQTMMASKEYHVESNETDKTVPIPAKNREQTVQIDGEINTVLQRTSSGYQILILGKNGEKRPNIPLSIEITHPLWNDSFDFFLRSNKNGIIDLGPLTDVSEVNCCTTDITWKLLEQDKQSYPSLIHGIAGEAVQLPLSREDIRFVRTIALFKRSPEMGFSRPIVKDCTSHVKLHDGLLCIADLEPGFYLLRLAEVKIDIVIASQTASSQSIAGLGKYCIDSNPMLQLLDSAKHPLYVQTAVANDDDQTVDIQLRNWTPATRVCITATKFVPPKPMFEDLIVQSSEALWSMQKGEMTKTAYRTGRVLGEEYQYVLNRKAQTTHWAGNLLTKPSALLTPWSVGETIMSKQEMEVGGAAASVTNMNSDMPFGFGGRSLGMGGAKRHRKILAPGGPPALAFMVHPSVVLANLVPDQSTGLLRLPYSAFKEACYLQICVTDNRQGLQLSLVVPSQVKTDFEKRDLRFKSALEYDKHYIGERSGVSLDPTLTAGPDASAPEPRSITLSSNGSSASAVRIINSVGQLYDLMTTLLKTATHKQHLRKFGFIVDWHRLSPSAKDEKFSKYNCHELNLFLYKKDRKYFDAVVAPFIKNKLVKSFMDDYLIGASLEQYTTLREFSLLTCLEKCVLAQRVPRLRPSVANWIRSRVRNTKVARDIKLFRTVMNSGALQEIGSDSTNEREEEIDQERTDEDDDTEDHDDSASDESDWEEVDKGEAIGMNLIGGGGRLRQKSGGIASVASRGGGGIPGPGLFGGGGSIPGSGLFGSAPAPATFAAPPAPPPPPRAFGQASQQQQQQQQQSTPLFGSAPQTVVDHRAAREQSSRVLQKQFKPVDLTKEMAETYYWGRQDIATESSRMDVNAFWLDFVEWNESRGRSFLSQNFVTNATTFTNAMATIALMDVHFAPRDASVKRTVDSNLVVTSESPAVVFHSSTKELQKAPITGAVLATQRYFELLDRSEMDSKLMTNVRKYIRPDAVLRPMRSYGTHVVLMNATPNPMKLHVEIQLPQGSISINSPLEVGQDIELEAHGTFQYEYHFYFPEAGDFLHYPVHVSDYEDIVAFAEPSALKLRDPEPGHAEDEVNTTTWRHVLRYGDQNAVLGKLKTDPLDGMDVELLLPRLYKDRELLRNVTTVLRDRHEFNPRIWSVSLALKDEDELVREYVGHQAIAAQVGDWFTSPLLDRRPRSRYQAGAASAFHYLEYFPLINARAHKATRQATILNDRFKAQYDKFLSLLCQKPKHDTADLLVLVVYLLAQDRILEAKNYFLKLTTLLQESNVVFGNEDQMMDGQEQQQLENRLGFQQIQYDYLRAYLSLCVEVQVDSSAADLALDLEGVERIVEKYQKYPVERWNRLFKDMRDYVKEIKSTAFDNGAAEAMDSDAIMAHPGHIPEASNKDETEDRDDHVPVTADFTIGSDAEISIRHRGVEQIMVEYYAIDAETMFSNSPLTFSEQGESETNTAANSVARTKGASESVSTSYRLVKPNGVDRHVVEQHRGAGGSKDELLNVPVLPQYRNTNVMISLSTVPPASTRTWRAYYSQTILVQCQEFSGVIKVVTKTENQSRGQDKSSSNQHASRPIRGAYTKVYAELKTGGTTFWKDGYTDLVGRFAYATVSSSVAAEPSAFGQKSSKGGLEDVKRFVVFVDGGKEGCTVKTLPVPPV